MTSKNHQTYTGACLYESVKFQFLNEKVSTIYRCYCSLCRKQSGTGSNAALLVRSQHFKWLHGLEYIAKFSKDTGFNSHFCKECGSPVPNALSNHADVMWIPLGLVAQDFSIERELSFCVNSQVTWAKPMSGISIQQYKELPVWQELSDLFNLEEK